MFYVASTCEGIADACRVHKLNIQETYYAGPLVVIAYYALEQTICAFRYNVIDLQPLYHR